MDCLARDALNIVTQYSAVSFGTSVAELYHVTDVDVDAAWRSGRRYNSTYKTSVLFLCLDTF